MPSSRLPKHCLHKASGQAVVTRTGDLNTSGRVWIYTPREHKNAWRGHTRSIFLAPRAEEVLRPWLRAEMDAFLFQPREVEAWHREQKRKPAKHRSRAVTGSERIARLSRVAGPGINLTAEAMTARLFAPAKSRMFPTGHPTS
jgi:hypothetical protein